MEEAEWIAEVPADRAQPGTVDIGITTMNRPDFCAKLLGQIGDDDDAHAYLDEVVVASRAPRRSPTAPTSRRPRRRSGASCGSSSRATWAARAATPAASSSRSARAPSTYVMMMDDDVVCEPEGILRAVTFGDLCRRPTIVGGHMFSLYAKSRLHSFGEIISQWRFWWMSRRRRRADWDFAARNLRTRAGCTSASTSTSTAGSCA